VSDDLGCAAPGDYGFRFVRAICLTRATVAVRNRTAKTAPRILRPTDAPLATTHVEESKTSRDATIARKLRTIVPSTFISASAELTQDFRFILPINIAPPTAIARATRAHAANHNRSAEVNRSTEFRPLETVHIDDSTQRRLAMTTITPRMPVASTFTFAYPQHLYLANAIAENSTAPGGSWW
jgi:hypothetical protein